jgi:hypothetical protein
VQLQLFNRKFKSKPIRFVASLPKLHVLLQLGIDVSDFFVRVPHPEVFKVLWDIVLAEPRQAEAPEGMSAILRLIKFGQDRVQRAPQNPCRCQAITVSGLTMTRAERQPL